MAADRFVVLGWAPARADWFRDVARWAASAAIPVEFVKTVSVEEVRVRLRSGRAFSALLCDGSGPIDRDLVGLAGEAGCAVVVVQGDGARPRDGLDVAGTLVAGFGREELVAMLAAVARPVGRVEDADPLDVRPGQDAPTTTGGLVAVTGPPGGGRSTVAMALAQGLGQDPRHADRTCLADLSLDADQGMLHDAPDVVPGLLELVDAHRIGIPGSGEVRALTWAVDGRGYRVLLGLRRHRDWTALRPRALRAALDGLRRSFGTVVVDCDADVEGEDETGSRDVEERNVLARTVLPAADLVVVVGTPALTGIRHLMRVIDDLRGVGVDPARVLPLINHAPRNPRRRAEIAAAVVELGGGRRSTGLPSPAFVAGNRRVEAALRARMPLPGAVVTSAATAVLGILGADPAPSALPEPAPLRHADAPVPIRPGSLGSWVDEEALP
ncbi:MAG: hypothetical protein AB7L84_11915 [Acidimicrobiia bacterium]